MLASRVRWREETWLRVDGQLHRPTLRERLSVQEFERQKRSEVIYTVYEWVRGTYSDGCGGRCGWRRV